LDQGEQAKSIMNEPIATYQSYLVRLWQDSPRAGWRASAQSIQTREIVHFADLDALCTFLWARTAPHPSLPQGEGVIGWTEET
jgi:hypothetical protein